MTATDFLRKLSRSGLPSHRVLVLIEAVEYLLERIQTMADATQQDIENLTQQVTQVSTDLGTVRDKLQAEIDALAARGVDVTALQNAVAPLDQAVNDLGNLQPTPPPTP